MTRPAHNTGVKITASQREQIKKAMEPTIEMDFGKGMTTTRTPGPRAGLEVLQRVAKEAGLPDLLPTYNYCLKGDEIVCLQEAMPQATKAIK